MKIKSKAKSKNLLVSSKESIQDKQFKEKLKREKTKNLIRANAGLEPIYSGIPETNSKVDLAKGLNYYSAIHTIKDSYEFLKAFIKEHHKSYLKKLETIKPDYVSNKGFVVRMIQNGFTFLPSNEVVIQNILDFIDQNYVVKEKNSEVEEVSVEVAKVKVNSTDAILNYVDEMIDNSKMEIRFEISNTKDIQVVSKYLNEILTDIKQNNLVESIDEKGKVIKEQNWDKNVISRINNINSYIESAISSTRKERVKRVTKKKPVDQNKLVKSLKYLVSEKDMKSIKPTDIIGKTKLYIFDTRYKKLRLFISTEGFTVKGTSLLNVDMSKSKEKRIKDKDIPALGSCKNISSLNNFFKGVPGNELPMTNNRTNEYCILLGVS